MSLICQGLIRSTGRGLNPYSTPALLYPFLLQEELGQLPPVPMVCRISPTC